MKTVVVLLFGLLAVTQGYKKITGSSRIVNGENAKLGEIPYQVSLQLNSRHYCGGSIISEDWVVTAAHCVYGYENSVNKITVVVGTISLKNPEQKKHQAERIIVHKKYNSLRNDIALIKVESPFEFSDIVKPVALPEPYVKVKANSSATVSGWGRLLNSSSGSPDRLQKVNIYIADQEYCRRVMEEAGQEILDTNICANDPNQRKGQCNGDSGGPLTVDGKLAGIVSWSIKDPHCASTKYPGVYTRASEYVEWILENANLTLKS